MKNMALCACTLKSIITHINTRLALLSATAFIFYSLYLMMRYQKELLIISSVTIFALPCLWMDVQIAYFVGVQMEEACKNQDGHGLSPEMRQLSAVGAVRVAVRSLSMGAGTSKS